MKTVLILLGCFIHCFASAQPYYEYKTASSGGTGKFYLGREISQVMDASGADWLERSSRPDEENTDLVISSMNLKPSMVVADIGAGTGYYTFRMAALLPQGKVYAVEIQEELINTLNKKKEEKKLQNVEVIRGDTLSVNLPAGVVDIAILVDVYHELSWPREIIQSIRKSLKADGRILLVEYRGEDPAVQIKPLHKTTVKQVSKEMEANGFVPDRRVEVLPIQHFLMFRKK
jgi:precorrin-6B methylase 2